MDPSVLACLWIPCYIRCSVLHTRLLVIPSSVTKLELSCIEAEIHLRGPGLAVRKKGCCRATMRLLFRENGKRMHMPKWTYSCLRCVLCLVEMPFAHLLCDIGTLVLMLRCLASWSTGRFNQTDPHDKIDCSWNLFLFEDETAVGWIS